ncbi:collagen alpha-2(I) chain-like [Meriones unguiculatus]|uniref:collagen alpha-2(I) chain-like n=1 Tax=Meriones unguiculatus TaxID=10047 RepID=UPI00293F27E8|nr:collagen alpha-2(I) chain-like [Meriones unguiculatus]
MLMVVIFKAARPRVHRMVNIKHHQSQPIHKHRHTNNALQLLGEREENAEHLRRKAARVFFPRPQTIGTGCSGGVLSAERRRAAGAPPPQPPRGPFFPSLTPPSSNKLALVPRCLLSARSVFPNTPTHPETRLRLHRTRRQEKRFKGGGEPRRRTGPGSPPGRLPITFRARRSPRCKGIPDAAGGWRGAALQEGPLRVGARPRRHRSPVRPRNRSAAPARCGGAGAGPRRGCGRRGGGPAPAHLAGCCGDAGASAAAGPRATRSPPSPSRPSLPPSSRAAQRGRRHCPHGRPATPNLGRRGRRLRVARGSEAALARPSSRRLSFSARRRRSGGGQCAGSTPAAQGGARRAGGRGGAARALTERARAAGSAGSPGARRALRTSGCGRPAPTAAPTGGLGARPGTGRWGPRGRPRAGARWRLRPPLTLQGGEQKCGGAWRSDHIPGPRGVRPRESWRNEGRGREGGESPHAQPWDRKGWSRCARPLTCRKCWEFEHLKDLLRGDSYSIAFVLLCLA